MPGEYGEVLEPQGRDEAGAGIHPFFQLERLCVAQGLVVAKDEDFGVEGI